MANNKLMFVVGANVKDFQTKMGLMTKDLNKMTRNAQRSIGPVMDKIGKAVKVMGVAAAAGFGAAVVGSVKGASSLEAYRNTLNVVMKDQEAAGRMMAWAVNFANKTPFETASIVDATVKLQAYGLEAQKVLPAVGDMAGVMNKDIIQAVEAVADAQTGELERLKEFGITKKMIIEQGNKIIRGVELVNSKGQIVDQENFNKALFSLMEERFQGGMEIQANSFTGLWSTVKGVFSTTLATMAGITAEGTVKIGGLFDNLKQKMQFIIDKLNEWQKNGKLQEWSDKTQRALSAFWNVGERIFNALVTVGKWIIDRWGLISPILAGVLAGFLAFKTVIAVINSVKIAMAALNLVMNLNPIGIVTLAVMGLVTAGVVLYRNWDVVREKLSRTWERISFTFQSAWAKIRMFLFDTLESMWQGIENSKLVKVLSRVWPDLFDNVSDSLSSMKKKAEADYASIGQAAMAAADRHAEAMQGIKTATDGVIEAVEPFEGTWAGIGQSVDDVNDKFANHGKVLEHMKGQYDALATGVEAVGKRFELFTLQTGDDRNTQTMQQEISLLKEQTDLIDEQIKQARALGQNEAQILDLQIKKQRVLNDIKKIQGEIDTETKKKRMSSGQALQGLSLLGDAGSQFDKLVSGMQERMGMSFSQAKEYASNVLNPIFAGLGESLNIKVPALANGGRVTMPGIAMVGERGPELLSMPRGAEVSPLPASGGNINVNIYGDTYGILDFESKVKSTMRDAIQGGGFRGVIPTP